MQRWSMWISVFSENTSYEEGFINGGTKEMHLAPTCADDNVLRGDLSGGGVLKSVKYGATLGDT